jgi:hypothetical protein
LEPVVDPVFAGGSVVLFGERAAWALALQPPPGAAPGAGRDAAAPGTGAFLPEVGAPLRAIGARGSIGSIGPVTPLGGALTSVELAARSSARVGPRMTEPTGLIIVAKPKLGPMTSAMSALIVDCRLASMRFARR